MKLALVVLGLAFAGTVVAAEPSSDALRQLQVKLMIETKIIAVAEFAGSPSEFKSDGDPNTLELVFLKNKKDGPSRVSDDGEVIFLYHASDRQQQDLITKAFETRARLRLAASN